MGPVPEAADSARLATGKTASIRRGSTRLASVWAHTRGGPAPEQPPRRARAGRGAKLAAGQGRLAQAAGRGGAAPTASRCGSDAPLCEVAQDLGPAALALLKELADLRPGTGLQAGDETRTRRATKRQGDETGGRDEGRDRDETRTRRKCGSAFRRGLPASLITGPTEGPPHGSMRGLLRAGLVPASSPAPQTAP